MPEIHEKSAASASRGPLSGLRILDLATIIAAPMAATLLADFGADVVKVELPQGGDGLRALRPIKDGVPLWWKVTNRNKAGITLDIRKPRGAELLLKMLPRFDVVVENFRPGTMEAWGLGPDVLWRHNPRLTILRVSGFGQTGPYARRPGFARVGDAMSGFQSLCGEPDAAPMHIGYPMADSVTGLYGALGLMVALYELKGNPEARGQIIDTSLMESMFRSLEFLAIEYDQLGEVRERTGNRNPYAAPGNVFQSRDGRWFTIASSTQSVFQRLMRAIGQPALAEDPRFATNTDRLRNVEVLEELIANWFAENDAETVAAELERHEVAAAPVMGIDDIFTDPHVAARDMIVPVPDEELGEVRMQAVHPVLSRTPGSVRRAGPARGADTDDVYRDLLGLDDETLGDLRADGVI